MEPRVTEVGPNEMILNVLDAVYSLQSCRGEREAEGWGAEEVRAKLAEMGLGAGGGGLEAALEGALEAALEGGYLREGPRGGYALAQPIDKFVALLKTSFGASPRRKPRPKTRRKDAQISKAALKKKAKGRKGRCEGCSKVRLCKCEIGCGCRVTCTTCKQDTVHRPKTKEARDNRLRRRQQKLAERKRIQQETGSGRMRGQDANSNNRTGGQSS